MPMKIGFNLLLWSTHITEQDFPILKKLKDVGYDGVEIPVFDTSDAEHFKKIGRALEDHGLQATAVTVSPDEERNPSSKNPAYRQAAVDHLKRTLDCARNANAELLCGPFYQVLGCFTGAYPTEEELEHAAEVHRLVGDHALQLGMDLVPEPLNRFESHLINTMEQAKAYVKRVNHPAVGVMYDTFHMNIEEKDPVGVIPSIVDVIRHVHISENDRGTPGRGHCPIPATIAAFKQAGYDRWFTIEAFGSALPDLAGATKVWRDFFPSAEQVYTEGFQLIKNSWESA
jgi:D-psicose/D-tagatose/L-ribulose 3-epimerase